MSKILIIALVVCGLFYFIARKISAFKFNNTVIPNNNRTTIDITIPTFILQNLLKKTLTTVGIGFLILLIILVIASKFKLALILLPLSFYLIGQYFVFNNHVKAIKSQELTYNRQTKVLTIKKEGLQTTLLDLSKDNISVTEVKSVQKNNSLLMGYYQIKHNRNKYYISYLLADNLQNKDFFDKLKQLNRNLETKLFPII